jgi:hypothetical protein
MLGSLAGVIGMNEKKVVEQDLSDLLPCPCCGTATVDISGDYEICQLCGRRMILFLTALAVPMEAA